MADRDDARPVFNPKHRIVGAIVLVALVVIFVPMILDEREPPAELKGVREAPPRTEVTETRVVVTPVPADEVKPGQSSEAAKITPPAEDKPVPETQPAAPTEKPAVVKKPEPAPEKPAKPAAAPDNIENGWIVQVGTFSNTQNALRLRDKLKSLGHAVHTDSVTIGGKKALRLRVGPFADRAKADRAQAQIRKEIGVTGVVQTHS
ncbi:MAG: hypothetical protein Tsb0026_01900 [Sulfuricaulis sp.]